MAINKINVKNKIYDFGGSGSSQAKLVATGTYDAENYYFICKTLLTENEMKNKFYALTFYINSYDTFLQSGILPSSIFYGQVFQVFHVDIVESLQLSGEYETVEGNMTLKIWYEGGGSGEEFSDGDIIEVYELPFTIGGAE